MSMNLYGAFKDNKNRTVCEIPLYQTLTELSYKIIPEEIDSITVTKENWKEKLKLYLEWVGDDAEHIQIIDSLFDEYGCDYTATIFVM